MGNQFRTIASLGPLFETSKKLIDLQLGYNRLPKEPEPALVKFAEKQNIKIFNGKEDYQQRNGGSPRTPARYLNEQTVRHPGIWYYGKRWIF